MSNSPSEVRSAALSMKPKERAKLAEQLLASLDGPERNEIDAAWAEEIERRIDEMESGKVKGIPAEEVFKKYQRRK
jgi:putative addiction module component (TIGR02574 family)